MGKKKKRIWIIGVTVLVVVCIAGFLWNKMRQNRVESYAMYVPAYEDDFLMIGQDEGAFTMPMPDKLYGIDGRKITQDQLKPGNILKLTGDGIMLATYPGKYPGVVKAEVVKAGSPSDAEQYRHIVEEFCPEPDPLEPPILQAQYTDGVSATGVNLTRGGYSWSYKDGSGNTQSVVADSMHILEWSEIADINAAGAVKLELIFSKEPLKVKVQRWPLEDMNKELKNIPEAEEVSLRKAKENYVIPKAGAGYVYEVTGTWKEGEVLYGFVIKESNVGR